MTSQEQQTEQCCSHSKCVSDYFMHILFLMNECSSFDHYLISCRRIFIIFTMFVQFRITQFYLGNIHYLVWSVGQWVTHEHNSGTWYPSLSRNLATGTAIVISQPLPSAVNASLNSFTNSLRERTILFVETSCKLYDNYEKFKYYSTLISASDLDPTHLKASLSLNEPPRSVAPGYSQSKSKPLNPYRFINSVGRH